MILGIIAAVIVIAVIYSHFNPASSAVPFPKCPFRMLTGYDCTGCGSQRALHAMLTGNFAAMFRYNAIFFPALLMVAALAAASLLKDRYPRFNRALNSTTSISMVLAVLILWTIIRNLI